MVFLCLTDRRFKAMLKKIEKSIFAFEKKYAATVLDYTTLKNFQPHEKIEKTGEIIFLGKDIKDLTKYPSAKRVGEIFLRLVPSLKILDPMKRTPQTGAEAVLQLNDSDRNALILFYVENEPQNQAFGTIRQTYHELKQAEFQLWSGLSQSLSKNPVDSVAINDLVAKSKTFNNVFQYEKLQKLGLLDDDGNQRISELDVKNLRNVLETTTFDKTQSKYSGTVKGVRDSVYVVEIYDPVSDLTAMINIPEATDQYNYAVELFCALKMECCEIDIFVPENCHSIVDFGQKPVEIRPVKIEFPFSNEEIIQYFSELLGMDYQLR